MADAFRLLYSYKMSKSNFIFDINFKIIYCALKIILSEERGGKKKRRIKYYYSTIISIHYLEN